MAKTDPLELVGTTLAEKYEINDIAGMGGYGIVYRATHLIWKRPVAIKVFKALAGFGEEEHQRLLDGFIKEGALLADLSERTAAICQARDVGLLTTNRGQRVPYMVLEWLEGETLEATIAREKKEGYPPRSIEEAVHLLQPAADALEVAHRQRVAHRDIKPGNIFLIGDPRSPECSVKVLDFGIAKVVGDAHKDGGNFNETSGQVTSFTPAYGAPEQFTRTHGSTGPWTDVFAFALVLVELLTGQEALSGETFMQVAYAAADVQRRPTPRALGAVTTDAVEAVFLKALAVKAVDRYQSAGEFWNSLREAIGFEPIRSIGNRVGPASREFSRVTGSGVVSQTAPGVVAPFVSASPTGGTAPGIATGPQSMQTAHKSPVAAIGLGVAAAVVFVGVGTAFFLASHHSSTTAPTGSATIASASAMASAAPSASAVVVAESTCPAGMIKIPGGKFFMGSDDPTDPQFERPAHNVTVAPYCMDEFEVTTKKYVACSDGGGCRRAGDTNDWEGISASDRKAFDPLCNVKNFSDKGDHPINCVTWQMADEFCKSQTGARLPTEAEWEFAARGPDGRKYPWGDEAPTSGYLNACGKECVAWGNKHNEEETAMYQGDDGFPNTAPVGSFPKGKSRYGVQDVVGNVWEWVSDYYAPYTADAEVDPKGPAAGTEKVIRGGAWNGGYPSWVEPTFRYKDTPTKRSYGIGFRCAKSLP
ncbi:MAG: bifunctional serine/threonine-protein kinase/formylglycine-generating enzyme family protein [Polyangiaceae bacterium]